MSHAHSDQRPAASDASALLPRFDPFDPDVQKDPYPTYRRLRASGPLCRAGPAQFAVTTYAEVAALLRDRRVSSEFPAEVHQFTVGAGATSGFLQRIMLYRDGPDQTRLRRLMGSAFHRSQLGSIERDVRATVESLLAPLRDRGALDAAAALAHPLPLATMCNLLSIPTDDRPEVRARALDLGKGFAMTVSEADRRSADSAVEWLRTYVKGLVADRRRAPSEDLLSRMLAAASGDGATRDDEIVDNVVFLFFAGIETTSRLVSAGLVALLGHRKQLAALRNDPSLVPSATEEMLRFDPPLQTHPRLVIERVEIGTRTVRPGRVLLLMLGSANRDERVFERPDEFDVTRTPNPHLSFGMGPHFCVGAHLARLENNVLLETLLARFQTLELAGPPTLRFDGGFRSFASVPIAGEVS